LLFFSASASALPVVASAAFPAAHLSEAGSTSLTRPRLRAENRMLTVTHTRLGWIHYGQLIRLDLLNDVSDCARFRTIDAYSLAVESLDRASSHSGTYYAIDVVMR
jgi:hypothetical protein